MQENMSSLIKAYEEQTIYGTEIVNELLRFKAIDQILASRPGVAQWGVSLDELWELAVTATVDTFGPMKIAKTVFGAFYQKAFSVNVMEFIEETGYIEGIKAGKKWKDSADEFLLDWEKNGRGKILFAHIEEYAAIVEDILQRVSSTKIAFTAGTDSSFEIFSKLYPLADIQRTWPESEIFDGIFFIDTACFRPPSAGLHECMYYLDGLAKNGQAKLFLSNRAFIDESEISKKATTLLFQNFRTSSISEWLPYGVYECNIDSQEHTKIRLSIKEECNGDIKESKLIALRHELTGEFLPFTISQYILASGGFNLSSYAEHIFMGNELEYIGAELPTFINTTSAAMWALFRESSLGVKIYDVFSAYAETEAGIFQLMEGVARPSYTATVEAELAEKYWKALMVYDEELKLAEDKWRQSKSLLLQEMGI